MQSYANYLFQEILHDLWVIIHRRQVQWSPALRVNQSNAANCRIFGYKQLNYLQSSYCARQMKCSTSVMLLIQNSGKQDCELKISYTQSYIIIIFRPLPRSFTSTLTSHDVSLVMIVILIIC